MDEAGTHSEVERIDTGGTLFLGVCTTVLAIAFVALLIGDSVSAMTF